MSGHPSYSEQPYTKIGQLQPDMHGVNVAAIVIDKGFLKTLRNGDTLLIYRIADPTGCICMTIMNPEAPDLFLPSDIVKLRGGFTKINKGGLTLGVGKNGDVVKCNEFFMLFSEQPNLSDYNYNPEWAAKERQKKGEAPDVQNETRPPEGGGPPMSNSAPSRGGHHPKSRGGGPTSASSASHRLPPAASSAPPSGAHPSRPRHAHASSSSSSAPQHSGSSSSSATNSAANGSHENNGRRPLNGSSGASTILDRLIS